MTKFFLSSDPLYVTSSCALGVGGYSLGLSAIAHIAIGMKRSDVLQLIIGLLDLYWVERSTLSPTQTTISMTCCLRYYNQQRSVSSFWSQCSATVNYIQLSQE